MNEKNHMTDNLFALSSSSHEERKAALIHILNDNSIPYLSQTSDVDGRFVENFIVRLEGGGSKRIVVGAHYDSVEGSTGANDNASGVCVLIELARKLSGISPAISLDIVFFDYEETGGLGGRLYLEQIGKKNIEAMINFDICGVGEKILAAPGKHTLSGPLHKAISEVGTKKVDFEIIDRLPTGDEHIFEVNGIPNISVCILPEEDVSPMKELFLQGKDVKPEDFPSIIETMHNGPRDSVEVVEPAAIKKVYGFAESLVMGFIRDN